VHPENHAAHHDQISQLGELYGYDPNGKLISKTSPAPNPAECNANNWVAIVLLACCKMFLFWDHDE